MAADAHQLKTLLLGLLCSMELRLPSPKRCSPASATVRAAIGPHQAPEAPAPLNSRLKPASRSPLDASAIAGDSPEFAESSPLQPPAPAAHRDRCRQPPATRLCPIVVFTPCHLHLAAWTLLWSSGWG